MLYRAYHLTVCEITKNASLYYEALLRAGIRRAERLKKRGHPVSVPYPAVDDHVIAESRKQFSYGFKPDYMFQVLNQPRRMIHRMKVLYGATQLDN